MRNIIVAIMCVQAAVSAVGMGVDSDTVKPKELKEVVAEAQMQHTSSNVTTYYPSGRSKRASQNAIDLLNQMAIPQINVNPLTGTVQSNTGDDVTVFIDMEPASQEEKDALRPEDVRKVEYYVHPTDPRFNQAKYAINITLRHYDYGGYAKLSGSGDIMAGSAGALAYTKMSYKSMTYDISVSDAYADRRHTGSEQKQVFRFPLPDGTVDEVTRSNLLDDSRYQKNRTSASFRAKYRSEKATVSNTLSFTAANAPHSDYSGRLLFSSDTHKDCEYSNSVDSRQLYPKWTGSCYMNLGNGLMMNATPSLLYQHTESSRRYRSDETSIVTDAKEDIVYGQAKVQLNKSFSKHHALDLTLMGVYVHDKVRYEGNVTASPTFDQYAYGGLLGYSLNRGGFYGRAAAGMAGETNIIDGTRTGILNPSFYLAAQYAPDRKNSINIEAGCNLNGAEAADKTPNVIQENELLYKTGNVRLKSVPWWTASADYTWLPNNTLSVSTFTSWRRYFSYVAPVFTPDGPDGLMLRSLENGGDYQDISVGATLSARLFNRSLIVRLTPRIWFERITGRYAQSNSYPTLVFSGTYYMGDFYLTAYYSSGNKALVQYSLDATSVRSRSSYMLRAGWSNGKWNCSVSAINILRSDWVNRTSSLNSRWFDQYTTEYNADSHRFVNISVSYTFGFGKKIRHDDEVETTDGQGSAIMK